MLKERSALVGSHISNAPAKDASHGDLLWAAAIDALPTNLSILDRSGKIVAVNESWRNFARENGLRNPSVGLGSCYIQSWEPLDSNDSPDASRAATGIRAVLEGRESAFLMEYACHGPDRQRWIRMRVTPIGEAAAHGAVVVHEDITMLMLCEPGLQANSRPSREHKQLVEQRVAQKMQRTRAIMDSAADVIVTAGRDDQIESFNAAAARMFGCAAAEAIGQPLASFFQEAQEGADAQPLNTAGSWRETYALRSDGTTIPIYLSTSDVLVDGESLRICIAHDISDRRAMETELYGKAEELARRNKELDEFTYVASHDLQEPLRKLIAFSELLPQDMAGKLPEIAQRDLHFIVEASTRMQQLIQDLLSLARTSRSDLRRVEINLNDAVDRTLSALAYRIAATGAKFTRDELPAVLADACLIEQLYQNLIGNAIKFSGKKSPQIHLTAERDSSGWVFGVRDRGIGIAPEYTSMIFAPFERLHSRESYEGTGIGLAISRKAVERHGGKIWVESVLGEGSHFKFTLR